ncbi:MAG: putative aminohydrolase SsnA [Chloroflexota bacterium]
MAVTRLLIINGRIVTWEPENQFLEQHAILVIDGKIHAISDQAELINQYPDVETLDAKGQLVMPGNICAHTHFYGAFARGMAIPGPALKDFPDILERLWWRLDRALFDLDVQYSALVSLVDAIKHGTTTLVDHHASPNAIDGSLDQIADAVQQAGVRTALCYEVTDRQGRTGTQAGIGENVRFLKTLADRNEDQLLAGTFGLHASLSLRDETLADCVTAVHDIDTGFHIHVAEHEADEYDSLYKYGKRVVHRLRDFGLLGSKSIIAHGVHIDAEEMNIIKETGAWVTHQPRSNMNNAVGAADIESLLRLGVPVCLGNDGFSNNMWAEWKMTYLMHKQVHRDPRRANGMDVVQMGIYNNAALAEMLWPGLKIGKLVEGAVADIIFVDYHATTPLSEGNLPWHIIFGFESSMVTTTIVNGKLLMHNRELLTLDEAEITARSRELAAQVWQRYETIRD